MAGTSDMHVFSVEVRTEVTHALSHPACFCVQMCLAALWLTATALKTRRYGGFYVWDQQVACISIQCAPCLAPKICWLQLAGRNKNVGVIHSYPQILMATAILRGNACRLYKLAHRGNVAPSNPHPVPGLVGCTTGHKPGPASSIPTGVTAVRLLLTDTAGLRRCRVVPVDRVWLNEHRSQGGREGGLHG